jgi:predicted alpha/beta-fold hydrolase
MRVAQWNDGLNLQFFAGFLLLLGLMYSDLRQRHTKDDTRRAMVILFVLAPFYSIPIYWLVRCWMDFRQRIPVREFIITVECVILFFFCQVGWSMMNELSDPDARDIATELAQAQPATQEARKAATLDVLNQNPYVPPWWMGNGHAQSFWGPLARRHLEVEYRSERWDTPDGDFIYVRFFDGEPNAPRVVLLHGLEGTANSPYIKGFNLAFHKLGWNVATVEFRFCSGEINKNKRIYHMGETSDTDFVVRKLAADHPDQPLYICGFSLGGNVLGKWLGEQGETLPPQVRGAAVISPPFDPLISAPDFHKVLGGFYAWNFLKSLKPKALAKAEQYPGSIDVEALHNCKDFYEYDTIVTAALHGFEDATDYWRKVGCHQFLHAIRVPTMLLTSADDPFNPPETIPREIADASPWLHPQWTEQGGHVGFVMGLLPWRPRYWMEEQTAAFFQAQEALYRP